MKEWFKERIPLASFDYEVPKYANTLPFSLGGITMINLLLLIVSGIVLAQFYNSSPDAANQSLRFLMTEVPLGNLIRGVHYWAAQLVMISLLAHLLRVFFYGSYKKPREANWLLGMGLFVLMVGLYYTGTILKWDQEAAEALDHTIAAAKYLGPLGFFFNPEFSPGVSLLEKILTLHISVLPVIVMATLVMHLYLVKALKISDLPYESKSIVTMETSGKHFKKLAAFGFITAGVVGLLATLLPPALGPVPVSGIESTKPPWLFMSIFSIENWTGLSGLIWASGLIVAVLTAVPFIDRGNSPLWKKRKAFVAGGVIAIMVFAVLTANAYVTKPEQHMGMGGDEQKVVSENPLQGNAVKSNKQEQIEVDVSVTKAASPELKALEKALVLIIEIKEPVAAGDYQAAGVKAKELDKTVDSIGAQIKAKDPALWRKITGAIHELGELGGDVKHNSEVNSNLKTAEESVNKAIQLFSDTTGETE